MIWNLCKICGYDFLSYDKTKTICLKCQIFKECKTMKTLKQFKIFKIHRHTARKLIKMISIAEGEGYSCDGVLRLADELKAWVK